ncbi:MAG TPA: carbohydrate ABC transporter substrate-binding protein, partial [Candidatus Merdenecus merdavium]|nr:carbohydrate ABC transporter substrate-binding protein [Candidatus Merdenecus merdavium]
CLVGCAENNSKEEDKELQNVSFTYKEQVLVLPERVSEITDITVTYDQVIRLAGIDETATYGTIWESADNGDTWNKVWDSSQVLQEVGVAFEHVEIMLSPDKKCVISLYINDEERSVYFLDETYSIIETSKEFNESIVDNKIKTFDWLNQDKVLALSVSQSYIVEIETGKITKLPACLTYDIADDEIYLLTSDGLKGYSINTGKEITLQGAYQLANEYLLDLKLNSLQMSLMVQGCFFTKTGDKTVIYLSDFDHILKIDENGVVALLDKTKMTIGDQRFYVEEFLSLSKTDEILLARGSMESEVKLIRYEQSDQKQETKNVLSIYALKEDESLKQVINMYQKQYPETSISLEIGIQNDEITVDEAIRVLNTRLASKDGPDILLLDGLNVNSYVKQGMLENLEDVVSEVTAKENVLTNILDSYLIEDCYYGIPLHFSAITFTAPEEVAKKTDTIEQITDALSTLSQDIDKPVFENWIYDQLVSTLYHTYLTNEDGSLSDKEIETFYRCIKTIYELVDMSEVEGKKPLKELPIKTREWNCADVVLTGEVQTAFDYIMTPEGIRNFAIAEAALSGQNYFFKTSTEICYSPLTILGIVTSSNEKEEAKRLISYALSKEVQSAYEYSGLAVNIETLQEQMKNFDAGVVKVETESGGNQNIEFPGLSEEQIKEWIIRFQSLNRVVKVDEVIFRMIMEQADDIVDGKITPTEGAENASRKIQLYLAE